MRDYMVVCHDERHREAHPEAQYGPRFHDEIGATHPHSTTLLLGSDEFGGLWHCPEHRDCPTCPRDPAYVRDYYRVDTMVPLRQINTGHETLIHMDDVT